MYESYIIYEFSKIYEFLSSINCNVQLLSCFVLRCRKKSKVPGFLGERWFRSCIEKSPAVVFDKILVTLKNCNFFMIEKFLENEKGFFN